MSLRRKKELIPKMRRMVVVVLGALVLSIPAPAAFASPDPDPTAAVGAAACSAMAAVENGKDTDETKRDVAQCFTQTT